jgi:hypothetical protein
MNYGSNIDFLRYIKGNYVRQANPANSVPSRMIPTQQNPYPHPPLNHRQSQTLDYRSIRLGSEAEVRVAIDLVHHSEPETGVKQRQKADLLNRLRSFTTKSGTQNK